MMHKLVCTACGKEFLHQDKRIATCSKECLSTRNHSTEA